MSLEEPVRMQPKGRQPALFVVVQGIHGYMVAPPRLELWIPPDSTAVPIEIHNRTPTGITVEVLDAAIRDYLVSKDPITIPSGGKDTLRINPPKSVIEFDVLIWGPPDSGLRAQACSDPRVVTRPTGA